MEKIKKVFTKILLSFLCMIIILSGVGCRKYYWDYDCYWISEDPQIVLDKGCGSGKMKIDDVLYEFYTYVSNNATYIGFYTVENDNFESKTYLWKADTDFKDDCLYLTITIDNISDYEGKVIKLIKSSNVEF